MDVLLWDEWSEPHLTRVRQGRRRVTRAEVDAMYESVRYVAVAHLQPLPNGDLELQRRLTGRTPAGRYLTVACQIVTAPDGREVFRPVTAWNAEAHEVETFRLDFPDD